MPAISVVDGHLRIPLRHVVLLARISRAAEKRHDLFLERELERRGPPGEERLREARREYRPVDGELHGGPVELELLHVEPAAHRFREPHEKSPRPLQIIADEGGRLVAEGVRIEVQVERDERVGGIVLVGNRLGAREEVILRVERGLDDVIRPLAASIERCRSARAPRPGRPPARQSI